MFRWGNLTITVTSASISMFLGRLAENGVSVFEITYIDDLNINLVVKLYDYQKVVQIAKKRGDKLTILHKSGILFMANRAVRRPVLMLFIVLWLFLVTYLPTRILFIQVKGNSQVSTTQILSAAQQCGIRFGASRRYVKSEKVKNALLSEIDSLKWVGVNTKGCVAVISVAEGAVNKDDQEKYLLSSIVALRDGVVTDITVTSGNVLCKVGQAVREGQVLVSGYTDCGLSVMTEKADGEIYGITRRNISAIATDPTAVRTAIKSERVSYSIQIGKNIIKLKKYSGILDPSCVKMYEKKNLMLPGGFSLPVSLIKETAAEYVTEETKPLDNPVFDWVDETVRSVCDDHMLAGKILQTSVNGSKEDGFYHYSGYYICRELIGKIRTEEIFDNNG